MAPTPFTAEEIRRGCPPGRTVTVRVKEGDAPIRLDTTRFVTCDEERAVMEMTVRYESGAESPPQTITASWRDLQAHASYEEDRTTITRETVPGEIGVFECLRYTVTGEQGVADFWFAIDLPGMPIRARAPGLEMDMVENVG